MPYRQIHLDFHTGPWIPDVGVDFDAREFARTLKRAHVNSVTVFAKCHHGHLYYNTRRPERHPGLKPGLDLLGEQVEALHHEDIRAPIYLSVQCDEYAADTHPEWIARDKEGRPVGAGPLSPGWQILDMSSPYQDFLAEQTAEVLRRFKPVDGIFFDMCWDQPSLNNFAVEGMLKQGFNPASEQDRGRYSHQVALAYMKRFHQMTRASSRNASVFFNSRPFSNLAEDIRFQEQVEIESLPTGGWGYMFFPRNVRGAGMFGKPYMGMTARFHKGWADFGGLKPHAALEYETSQMIAHGARCSIGDQLHPRGVLDKGAYELIGRVYERVEAREPWLKDARPVAQIGLFQVPGAVLQTTPSAAGTDDGATRMLTQLKHQFTVVGETSDLERYELLILPDAIPVSSSLARRLRTYLKSGGALLATGTSGFSPEGSEVLLPELGVKAMGLSPFTVTYLRARKAIAADLPPSDHVVYDRSVRVVAGRGTRILAGIVEPYFERSWNHFCSHNQTPGDKLSRYAAATVRGRVAYISYPVFSSYAAHGNYPLRLLVRSTIDLLLPERLLSVEAPTGTEATVMRQRNRTIVHLLHYSPERRAANLDIIEDIVPLRDVRISLRMVNAPRSVSLAPEQTSLVFEYAGGRVSVVVPEVRGHAMVVVE